MTKRLATILKKHKRRIGISTLVGLAGGGLGALAVREIPELFDPNYEASMMITALGYKLSAWTFGLGYYFLKKPRSSYADSQNL